MKKKNIFWGVIFLLIAVCILIGELGYFPGVNVFKLLLAAVLVAIIIKSIPERSFAGILFPLAFLCILFDETLHIESLTPWPVLAVALFGSIGLSFLFPKKKGTENRNPYESADYGEYGESVTREDGNCVEADVTFNAAIKYINSEHFERGRFSVSFGSLKLYFDQAKPQNATAWIETDTSFGTTIFYFPRDWNVSVNVSTSFGHVEEKGPKPPAPNPAAPSVAIGGSVSFGNLEINYI